MCVECPSKRKLFKLSAGIAALSAVGALPSISYAASLTKEQRDKMTPDDVIQTLLDGNKRFVSGNVLEHNYRAQQDTSQHGQYPSAVILSCIDSRAPAEIILDTGLGSYLTAEWQATSPTVTYLAVWSLPVMSLGRRWSS